MIEESRPLALASCRWTELQDALVRWLNVGIAVVTAAGDIIHKSRPFALCRVIDEAGLRPFCQSFYRGLARGETAPEPSRTALCPAGLIHHVYPVPGLEMYVVVCGGICDGKPTADEVQARLDDLLGYPFSVELPPPRWAPRTTAEELSRRADLVLGVAACVAGQVRGCSDALRRTAELALSFPHVNYRGIGAMADLASALLFAVLDGEGSYCIVRGSDGRTLCFANGALIGLRERLAAFHWERLAWEPGAPAADEQLARLGLMDPGFPRKAVALTKGGTIRGWLGVTGSYSSAADEALQVLADMLTVALEDEDLCHCICSQFGNLLELFPLGVFILDTEGRIRFENRQAARLTGLDRTALRGRKFTEALRMEIPPPALALPDTGHIPAAHQEIKVELERRDVTLGVYRLGVPAEDGSLAGSLLILADSTELAVLREQIRGQEKIAIAGQLAASIAHEIRNPLTAAAGFLQLIAEAPDSAKVREYAGWVSRELEHIRRITSDFLSLARPRPPERRSVNPAELLEDLYLIMESEATLYDISLQMDVASDLPEVWMDPDQIRQVILNLFKNAVQAMDNGGRLMIGVRAEDNHLVIKVADTGKGIPPDVLPHIFQPFQTTKEKGTGLGLTVCRHIVEAHGGRITVESSRGVGTTFRVFLPLGNAPPVEKGKDGGGA